MATFTVNIGETGTTVTSVATSRPHRASQHDFTAGCNTYNAISGIIDFTSTRSNAPGNSFYPIRVRTLSMTFPALSSTQTGAPSEMMWGNTYPLVSTASAWTNGFSAAGVTAFTPTRTNALTVSTTINYSTFAGNTDSYMFTYGAGKTTTGANTLIMEYGAVTSSPNQIHLYTDNTPQWNYDRSGKLRANVTVWAPPEAPTSFSVININATNSSFRVVWRVPTESGGTAVTGYRVVLYDNISDTYSVKIAQATASFGTVLVGGVSHYYYDVTGAYTSGGRTYDVYVGAYNDVTTTANGSTSYYTVYAHTGQNAVRYGVFEYPDVSLNLERKTADTVGLKASPGSYVTAPAGNGSASWSITGTTYTGLSGTVSAGSTLDLSTLSPTIAITTYPWSGELSYTLSATNSVGTAEDQLGMYPVPDAAPTSSNLVDWSGSGGTDNGSIDLSLDFTAAATGNGGNGRTYARIYRGSYTGDTSTVVATYSLAAGATTHGIYTPADTGLTPGQTYYYRVYLYNNAGYYSSDITAIATAAPTVSIDATRDGYFIIVDYSVESPSGSGDTYWTIFRSDSFDEVDSGVVSAGSSITESLTDEAAPPGGTYTYEIIAYNDSPAIVTDTSPAVTIPSIDLGGFTGYVGSNTNSPTTGSQAVNTDWMSGVTFSSGNTSGAWSSGAGAFTTIKPVYVYNATVHFRSGGSGTVQLQMSQSVNPSNSSNTGRYYKRTRASATPITIDPDTDLTATFNPRDPDDNRLITTAGQQWYVGFRMISGSAVLFYRGAGDSGAALITDNTIYKNGVDVNSDFGPPAASIYVDFIWRSVPSAPLDFTAEVGANDPTTEVDLSWTSPDDMGGYLISGYRVLYRPLDGEWTTTEKFGTYATTSYTVTGLEPDTEYEFVVAATNMVAEVMNNGTTDNSYTYPNVEDHVGTNSEILSVLTEAAVPLTPPAGTKVAVSIVNITSYSVSNGAFVFTTSSSHGFIAEETIVSIAIDDLLQDEVPLPPSVDGLYYVSAVNSSTQFVAGQALDENSDPLPDSGPYTVPTGGTATEWAITSIKVKKNGSFVSTDVVKIWENGDPETGVGGAWADKLPEVVDPAP